MRRPEASGEVETLRDVDVCGACCTGWFESDHPDNSRYEDVWSHLTAGEWNACGFREIYE